MQLLKLLKELYTRITDNVTYHSVEINKDPSKASTKNDILCWLQSRGAAFPKVRPKLNYSLR